MSEVLMFMPDDSPPSPGLYQIRLGRGCPMRALMVVRAEGLWTTRLDSQILGQSEDWKIAFGWLHEKLPLLKGQLLSRNDYLNLVENRMFEALGGADHTQKINHSKTKVAL